MKHIRPALMLTLFFVIVTGVAFPVAVWAIGSVAFPKQAHGSLVRDGKGNVVHVRKVSTRGVEKITSGETD